MAGCLLVIAAGCENANNKTSLAKQIIDLKHEKTQLQTHFEHAQAEKQQLKKQLQALSGLDPQTRIENLYDLQKIKITKYTNLYDKDKNGKKETLIVYIQPIDEDGDIIKATGSVDVQLWDLSKNDNHALIGQWHVKPDELKKLWFPTLITINYRLAFDISDKINSFEEPLTVKVTFTDYLTGKVFKEQKPIKP